MNKRASKKGRAQGARSIGTPPTPLRAILEPTSGLLGRVESGIGAVKTGDRNYLDEQLRHEFLDSIDLDEAFREEHGRAHRWDYLLGHGPSSAVVAVEPHSAKDDEVSRIISKKKAAQGQLRGHIKSGGRIAVWLWVASGRVQFANTEKTRRILDQNGIGFAGSKVLHRHLPLSTAAKS